MLRAILETGDRQANRTGIDAVSMPGYMLRFDLTQGFPAVTTKKLFFDTGVVGELVGFLRGYDNAADFRKLGCNIWNDNANKNKTWLANPNRKGEDDLGRIYGVQWRSWHSKTNLYHHPDDRACVFMKTESLDQVQKALDTIKNDPTNRRIIVNAWRPDEFDQMSLPPCHILYQFLCNVERKELSMCMYQRSCDSFLGVPFNIASSALFLSIIAKLTGYTPRWFTHFLADAHIYVNHFDAVNEQLSRSPFILPKLQLSDRDWTVDTIEPTDIQLINYQHHPAIKAPMAI